MVSQIQVVDPDNIAPRADKTDIDFPGYGTVAPGSRSRDLATPRQLEYIKERLDSGTLPINLEQGAKRFLETDGRQPLKSYTSDLVGALKKHEAGLKEPGLNQSTSTLDRITSLLNKYREAAPPLNSGRNFAPAVSPGSEGSKEAPQKLSEEEFATKQSEILETNKNVLQSVLSNIKDLLSPGKFASWRRTFTRGSVRPLPVNPVSDSYYRGSNLIALDNAASENGFSDPRWMTYSQITQMGGSVKPGTKGTKILVPTLFVTEVNGKVKELYIFKEKTVFNGDQVDGIRPYDLDDKKSYTTKEAVEKLLDRIREAAELRSGSAPTMFGIQLDKNDNPRWMPNYGGSIENIRLPLRANFENDEAWFQTLAHELIHSTGARTRLNRQDVKDSLAKDSDAKGREEITAELGSLILARMFGVGVDEKNSAAYIKSYLKNKNVPDKEIVDATLRAQSAVDYLLGNDVLPVWNPESTKVAPTEQSLRMGSLTPGSSSLNPIPDPDLLDLPAPGLDQAAKKPESTGKSVSKSSEAKQKVLAALLDSLKDGKTPWRKPFTDGANFAGAFVSRNPASKHIYTGINAMVLKFHQQLNGYDDPRWMTYKQAETLGGNVRRGEKGVPILRPIAKPLIKDKDDEIIGGGGVFFSTVYVFNVSQIDGLNLPSAKDEAGEPKTPLEAQDFILERYAKSMEAKGLKAPEVVYTYVGAYGNHSRSSSPNWASGADLITLPTKEQFTSPEDMFNTITHELAHSTGHKDRLDRSEEIKGYGSDSAVRGREELIAEISAAILASMFGVNSDVDNTAAYVKSWLAALKDDPEMITKASSEAQKVVDYILGIDLGDWSPVEGYSSKVSNKKEEEPNE
jgi:antirestriction protein ArdC